MKNYVLVLFVFSLLACNKAHNNTIYVKDGFAIGGYDVMAFYTENKPVKGTAKYSHEWKSATWLFSSQSNMEKFAANPDNYAPQYGGFCAYGCSDGEGHKAPTDPETWTIVNGKLYFNYNIDVKALWLENQMERIEQADKNWPRIMND